jgi:hypothetical protein
MNVAEYLKMMQVKKDLSDLGMLYTKMTAEMRAF